MKEKFVKRTLHKRLSDVTLCCALPIKNHVCSSVTHDVTQGRPTTHTSEHRLRALPNNKSAYGMVQHSKHPRLPQQDTRGVRKSRGNCRRGPTSCDGGGDAAERVGDGGDDRSGERGGSRRDGAGGGEGGSSSCVFGRLCLLFIACM